ncbi:MAG: hypothetical protein ACOC6H_05035 [Thermoproteota archaeon]
MLDKISSSILYETFLEKTSNLKSRALDTYERARGNISEHKEEIANGLKDLTAGAIIAGMTLGATPGLAEDNDKKVKVPIGQVTQHKEDCQLSANQLIKEEVEVLEKCVNEDYLNEIGYEESEDEKASEEETVLTDFGEKINIVDSNDPLPEELRDKIGSKYQIDEFRLEDFDGYSGDEGVFADNLTVNGEKMSIIAFYPFGSNEWDAHDTAYVLRGQHVNEIREGDLDGDGNPEVSIFAEDGVYNVDSNRGGKKVKFLGKYPAPSNQRIVDGEIEDGIPYIAVRGESDLDVEFSIKKWRDGKWKSAISDNMRERVLNYLVTEAPFRPRTFLVEDFTGDGENEILVSDGKDTVYVNESDNNVFYNDGPAEGMEGDLQYVNPAGWHDEFFGNSKKVIAVPTTNGQREYNFNGKGEKHNLISASPTPGEKKPNLHEGEVLSAMSLSDQVFTDFQVVEEFDDMNVEEWDKKYRTKDFNPFPWVGSTMKPVADNGFIVTSHLHFKKGQNRLYYFDFNAENLPDFLDEAEYKEID